MRRDVIDPLGAYIDNASVAHAFELFFAGHKHSCLQARLRLAYDRPRMTVTCSVVANGPADGRMADRIAGAREALSG
jgi:hypothetical protein